MKICSAAKKCGGCKYQGIEYKEQLVRKQNTVNQLMGKYCKVSPIIGMNSGISDDDQGEGSCLYYRNKVHHVLSLDRKHNIISGSYEEGSHKIIPTDECMLEDQESQQIIKTIRQLAASFKIRIYDEDTGYGLLRHVLIRKGFATGQIMVVLVAASAVFPSKNNFVKALRNEHPNITTVVLNINNRTDSMVLGNKSITVYGPGYIEDILCGSRFRISPDAFYQINPVQTEKLYRAAIDMAELKGGETIIDAYCGIGTIGLSAVNSRSDTKELQKDLLTKVQKLPVNSQTDIKGQTQKGRLVGIELNANAVNDAKVNAKLNNITNARFYKGDAGEYMEKMAAAGEKADVVFMDPPRAGSDMKFLRSLIKLGPARIAYISCNPETQARDVKTLTANGYKVRKIQPVDMFPYTGHVENICLLSKNDNAGRLNHI